MKLRIYLDTSVLSALFDERTPERAAETREFWDRLPEFEVSTSTLVRQEIDQVSRPELRGRLLSLLDETKVCEIDEEMRDLASGYIDRGLFAPTMYNDSLHLACAVLLRQDILVSWNFKHLVNRRKRAQVNEANVALGLPGIEIVAPSEV